MSLPTPPPPSWKAVHLQLGTPTITDIQRRVVRREDVVTTTVVATLPVPLAYIASQRMENREVTEEIVNSLTVRIARELAKSNLFKLENLDSLRAEEVIYRMTINVCLLAPERSPAPEWKEPKGKNLKERNHGVDTSNVRF